MRSRTRAMAIGVSLAASVLLLQGSALGAATGNDRGGHTLTFDVLFSDPSYTDLGAPGFSAADVLVFHDQLLQSGNAVGDEVGSCVLVDETGLSNCSGVVQLENRGTIAFSFVNAPPPTRYWQSPVGLETSEPSVATAPSTRTEMAQAPSFCGSSADRAWVVARRVGGDALARVRPEADPDAAHPALLSQDVRDCRGAAGVDTRVASS